MITALKRIVGGAALIVSLSAFTPANVECIAPADPGGGWDFTCRTVGKLLYDQNLVPGPVQVTNMAGGVGAVAYANVASKRPGAENLIVATSTVGITQIAQGKYPADADVMRWIGMLGTDVGVVLVPKESPIRNLAELLASLKSDPGSVVAAGSSGIGGWDHIRLLMLAQETGVTSADLRKIRWVQFDGGGPAVTQMLGGHVGTVVTDLGEVAGFVESGDVRILAALSDERIPAFPDVPTAKEQGIDVTGYNWRGFYTGGEVSDEAYRGWVDILKNLYESEEWKETATSKGLVPIWRGGEEFQAFVNEQVADMREISKAIGIIR
ncbi:tripartite tricarboxylate transporter substrate binding protein (plasmid) [Skermanella rosea]|uniref:Bug family tripartite tricarboxylate transporter substrate binding protein n=1 Tax=Skermanella rosea TaxID=1817965 RepID=UPI001931B286|nr:tripartite tricarboxylate transporter substrate binding protein [Skermanella rosea]UEM07552.1 tripartite tricarboxylate transporter substrate binding protein [Skermanella rosea]